MNDDDPVPDNVERQEQIEYVRRVKDARLECGKEGDSRGIVRIPEGHLERLYEANPEVAGWNKKSRKISFNKNI